MPPSKKKSLELEKRRTIVAANILAGLNYRDIAAALDVSIGTVANDVKMILKRMRAEQVETIEEAALVDLRRIDVLINGIWDKAKKGDLSAIDRMERLLRRRAEMLGYDEKVLNINLSGTVDIEDVRSKRWDAIADKLGNILANPTDDQEEDVEDDQTDHDAEEG